MRDLISHECVGKCDWNATGEATDAGPVYSCGGCGSEWTPGLAWTPKNADGIINPEITALVTASGPTDGAGGGSVGSW